MKLIDTIRWCEDLGMHAIDRSREHSCIHATEFCKATCYNQKSEDNFKQSISAKDRKNDIAWNAENTVSGLSTSFARRKTRQTKRARMMTRGEAFRDQRDIARVCAILDETPATVWWIPTRSWRDPILWTNVRNAMAQYSNVRLMASTDPSTSDQEYAKLERQGVSTMFYGDDERRYTPSGARMFMCPKTHKHLKAHCAICKAGCFNSKKPVHVHLKQH